MPQSANTSCPTSIARATSGKSDAMKTQSPSEQASQPAAGAAIPVTSTEGNNIPTLETREAMLNRGHLAPTLYTTETVTPGAIPLSGTESKPAANNPETQTNAAGQTSIPCP